MNIRRIIDELEYLDTEYQDMESRIVELESMVDARDERINELESEVRA